MRFTAAMRSPLALTLLLWFLALVAACTALVMWNRIDLTSPLYGEGDVALWEHLGAFFERHLSFSPFPSVRFETDDVFYPFGLVHVFQAWGLEREYLGTLLRRSLGQGPWVQLHFLLGLVVTASGLLTLASRLLPVRVAAAFSLFVTFGNAYALHKFPSHVNIAVAHWTLLALLTDVLLFRNVVLRLPTSLAFLAWRAFLCFAVLGLDLGYVAGYAFTSLFLTAAATAVLVIVRVRNPAKDPAASDSRTARWRAALPRIDVRHAWKAVPFGVASVALAFLYVPIILEILFQSSHFAFERGSGYWANPVRLLLPYLPGIDRVEDGAQWIRALGDRAEEAWDWSAGVGLLALSALGTWGLCARKKAVHGLPLPPLLPLLPLGLLLALCLLHTPGVFPVLNVFPWFKYHRVAGRSTLILTFSLAVIVAWAWRENVFQHLFQDAKVARLVRFVLIPLLALETIYGFFNQKRTAVETLTGSNRAYFNSIARTPGDALFEFPACIAGGNDIGEAWCPDFHTLANLGYLSAYHGKKGVSIYMGRVHPSQLRPIEASGYKAIAQRAARTEWEDDCLSPAEWTYLETLLGAFAFGGLQLNTRFLPARCVDAFAHRFGAPTARTALARIGEVTFTPLRVRTSAPAQANDRKVPVLAVPFPAGAPLDLLSGRFHPGLVVDGVVRLESAHSTKGADAEGVAIRSACIEASLFPNAVSATTRALAVSLVSVPDDQKVTFTLGDVPLAESPALHRGERWSATIPVPLTAGENLLRVCHARRLSHGKLAFLGPLWQVVRAEGAARGFDQAAALRSYFRENAGRAAVYERLSLD